MNNIKRTFPGKKIVLWPTKDQVYQSVAFVEGITGLKFDHGECKAIESLAKLERFSESGKNIIGPGAAEALFDIYLKDLDILQKMPGVTLMASTPTSDE